MSAPLVIALLSAVLQLAAALYALRLVRVTGRRVAWLLLSSALVLMTVRRLMVFRDEPPRVGVYELAGLAVSLLVLLAVRGVGRLLFESARARRTTEALHAIERRILELEPRERILQHVCEATCELLGAPLAWIGLAGAEGLRIGAAAGPLAAAAAEIHRHAEEAADPCPAEAALAAGDVEVRRGLGGPDAPPWARRAFAAGLHSAAAAPLLSGGESVGVLCVYGARADSFDEDSATLLRVFASGVALALQQARQLDDIGVRTAALEAAANAVVITTKDGVIEWVNPAFTRLTGWRAQDAIGQTPRVLSSGVHSRPFFENLWQTILAGHVWHGELTNRRRDGTLYVEEQTITPLVGPGGAVERFVAIKQDVSARREAEERIQHLALHDALTDLPNRRALEEDLRRAADRARRGHPGALLLLDLDYFKQINDTLGHSAGDHVLVELAALLRAAIRPADTLGRLGGDEFVLLVDEGDGQARRVAERLRQIVGGHRFSGPNGPLALTVSIGLVPVDGEIDATGTLALADLALYDAKRQGRNRIGAPVTAVKGRKAVEASLWIGRIKDALRRDAFFLEYQPIVRLDTLDTRDWEALLRMRDGDGPPVAPSEFLPAAERFGLATAVDRWVTERALEELHERPALRLWVNLGGATIASEETLAEFERLIRASGVAAGRLSFEITETAAVSDLGGALRWMHRLGELGCRFALDDFGIGFSSFQYLQALPAEFVKIDGSFVRGLSGSPRNQALVAAIVGVSRALGKETIAEGIESPDTPALLRELGVGLGQGWALGRPEAFPATRDTAAPV